METARGRIGQEGGVLPTQYRDIHTYFLTHLRGFVSNRTPTWSGLTTSFRGVLHGSGQERQLAAAGWAPSGRQSNKNKIRLILGRVNSAMCNDTFPTSPTGTAEPPGPVGSRRCQSSAGRCRPRAKNSVPSRLEQPELGLGSLQASCPRGRLAGTHRASEAQTLS